VFLHREEEDTRRLVLVIFLSHLLQLALRVLLSTNFNVIAFTAECSTLDYDDNDDAKAREKDAALHSALSRLSDDFGYESMLSLQRFFRSRRAPVIPTGSLKLDIALGTGGLPKVN
jgi:recombination protein RecA